jgi:hypothetical protein
MLAYRRADIAALNQLARIRMITHDQLSGPRLTVNNEELGDRTFQAGDHVLLRRNNYSLGVRNGDRGTIMSADPYRGEVAVHRPNDGATIVLPPQLSRGRRDGSRLRSHPARQPRLTVQRSHVLANDALFYEAGLVALSRHRDICQIYLAGPVLVDDREVSHVRQQSQRDVIPASDQLDNLSAALRTSRADEAALDHVEEPLRPDRFDGRTVR